MLNAAQRPHPGSYRDPSGHVFRSAGVVYRRVNPTYREHYDHLVGSGLQRALVDEGLVLPFEEVETAECRDVYRIIKPEQLSFISYPYEWSFGQLQDAATTTLAVQQRALEHGMVLKDASAYNIQFHRGRPVLIDTLSFKKLEAGAPWVAYRQFCQHFVAPLALMAHMDVRLSRLLSSFIDGLPLDLASRLLPRRTWLSGLAGHIHLHARSQARYANGKAAPKGRLSPLAMRGLIESLASTVSALKPPTAPTEWGDYYAHTNYSEGARNSKLEAVRRFIQGRRPKTVWDVGANTGQFSRIAAEQGAMTIAFDGDPTAVETHYRECRRRGETRILPLILDLTNPSSDIGWASEERQSFIGRGPADLVMALAVTHHLAISNNVPFVKQAEFFARVGRALVVEFVPRDDSQVRRLLATRKDIFEDYSRDAFERAFSSAFTLVEAQPVEQSGRVLYLFERRP